MTKLRGLVNYLVSNPLPLPVWLWNIIVVYIYITIGIFALRIGIATVAAIIYAIF